MYKKVCYREYTDGTFKHEKPHPSHLGFLGPIIKGEVGDIIKVHFKNMADRPFTVHAHGLYYTKAGEGSIYADHSSDEQQRDDKVEPNNVYTYNWIVNEQHAPTETDEDCVTRMYHSHVISVKDTNTGLIGIEGSRFLRTYQVSLQCLKFWQPFCLGKPANSIWMRNVPKMFTPRFLARLRANLKLILFLLLSYWIVLLYYSSNGVS